MSFKWRLTKSRAVPDASGRRDLTVGPKQVLAKAIGHAVRALHVQLVRNGTQLKPWDRQVAKWIAEAGALGKDPNDIGDDWSRGRGRPGEAAT